MDSTPFALAPGTGASVSTWSLGMSVPELTLAGACSRLAQPTAAFPSASPHSLEEIQEPHSPHVTAPGTPGHRGGDRHRHRMGVPAHSSPGSPIAPSPGARLPFPQHRAQVAAGAGSLPTLATSPAFQLSAQISL